MMIVKKLEDRKIDIYNHKDEKLTIQLDDVNELIKALKKLKNDSFKEFEDGVVYEAQYFSNTIKVSGEILRRSQYIATDQDGEVYAYKERPFLTGSHFSTFSEYDYICDIRDSSEFEDSLVKIEDLNWKEVDWL